MLAADLIKEHEGCKLEAYLDIKGVPTIGWGSTGKDIYIGLKWTQQQADDRFNTDLLFIESQVRSMLTKPVTDNQIAAMVCLAYNIGINAFRKSTVLLKLNQGDIQGAADAFLLWDKITVDGQNKEVSQSLFNRRVAERAVFLTP